MRKSLKFARILGADRRASGLLALMLLGACGQKGALYLPPPEPQTIAPTGESKRAAPTTLPNRP